MSDTDKFLDSLFNEDEGQDAPSGGNDTDRFLDNLFTDDEPEDERGDFGRGFKTTLKQVPQLGHGLTAGIGAMGETALGKGGISTWLKNRGLRGYQDWSEEIQKDSKQTDSASYSWKKATEEGDIGALADWFWYGAGYTIGQGLQIAATGGLGGAAMKIAGKAATKKLASSMVKKEIAKLSAEKSLKGVAKEELEKHAVKRVAQKIGENTAMAGTAFGMEGGEIFGGITEEAAKTGEDASGWDLARGFGAMLAAGGLEFVGDRLGLDLMLGKSKAFKPAKTMTGLKGRVARAGLGASAAVPVESGTEFAQTLIEVAGQGHDPFTAESLTEAIDAMALGGLGGQIIGSGGGFMSSAEEAKGLLLDEVEKIDADNFNTVDDVIKSSRYKDTIANIDTIIAEATGQISDISPFKTELDKLGGTTVEDVIGAEMGEPAPMEDDVPFPEEVSSDIAQLDEDNLPDTEAAQGQEAALEEAERVQETPWEPGQPQQSQEEWDKFSQETLAEMQTKQAAAGKAKRRQEQIKEIDEAALDEEIEKHPEELRQAADEEVKSILDADPTYQAFLEGKKQGVNIDSLIDEHGPETVNALYRKYPGLFTRNGRLSADEFAEQQKFDGTDDMVQSFLDLRTKKELSAKILEDRAREWGENDRLQQEAEQRTEGWTGSVNLETVKPKQATYPAPEQDVAALEQMIRANPGKFGNDDITHWTYSSPQKKRLRKALDEAESSQEASQKAEQTKEQIQPNLFESQEKTETNKSADTTQETPLSTETIDNPESAAHGQEVNVTPTEPMKSAENYKKAHVKVDDLDIAIENPINTTRSGKDKTGREWSQDLKADYGYIKGSKGYDKDHVDVFIKPGYQGGADTVHIVNQVNEDGSFDEQKVIFGAKGKVEAKRIYNSNYEKGWKGGKSVVAMPMAEFKEWVKSEEPAKGEVKEDSVKQQSRKETIEKQKDKRQEPEKAQKQSSKDNSEVSEWWDKLYQSGREPVFIALGMFTQKGKINVAAKRNRTRNFADLTDTLQSQVTAYYKNQKVEIAKTSQIGDMTFDEYLVSRAEKKLEQLEKKEEPESRVLKRKHQKDLQEARSILKAAKGGTNDRIGDDWRSFADTAKHFYEKKNGPGSAKTGITPKTETKEDTVEDIKRKALEREKARKEKTVEPATPDEIADVQSKMAEEEFKSSVGKAITESRKETVAKSKLSAAKRPYKRAKTKEQGQIIKTGETVTLEYAHNTESATDIYGIPDKDSPYGRGYEPSGKYITPTTIKSDLPNIQNGKVTFNNPLVIENDSLNWKKQLSEEYDGKTGKKLSKALRADGYDAVITVDSGNISETLDLTTFDEKKARFSIADDKDLYVAHNLSESNLRHVLELGGLAAPSLAVPSINKTAFTSFGEITLLADPSLLFSPKTKVFDADVYSPRHPQPVHDVDIDAFNEMVDSLGDVYGLDIPGMGDIEESRGFDSLARNHALQLSWLRNNGVNIKPKKKRVPVAVKKVAGLDGTYYGLIKNEKVEKMAAREAKRELAKIPEEVRADIENRWFDENGNVKNGKIRSLVESAIQYRDTKGYDTYALKEAVTKKMRTKKNSKGFEKYAREVFSNIISKKKIFKGYTNAGYRKYIPYTLENIVKEMTRQLQGGESFNYGAGSVRSTHAKRFGNLKAIQRNRDRLVSKEEMDTIRDESNDRLSNLLDDMRQYYKFDSSSFGYMDDASQAIAEGRRGLSEAFDLPQEMYKEVDKFTDYLRNLPTEYFEAKVQRGASLSEFHTAVVPKGTDTDLVKSLRDKGLKVKYYEGGNQQDRVDKVKSSATLFSKDAKPAKQSDQLPESQQADIQSELSSKKNLGSQGANNLLNSGQVNIVDQSKAEEILSQHLGSRFSMTLLHGSGTEGINKFSLEKAGTNDGTAFGHGIYLTDSRAVSRFYAEHESGKRDGAGDTPLRKVGGRNIYKAIVHEGKKPSEYDYVDWESITHEQKGKLVDHAKKTHTELADAFELLLDMYNDGGSAYRHISDFLGSEAQASKFFLDAGIDGIKYRVGLLTQEKHEGHNYVVFDENAIQITESIKYSKDGRIEAFTMPDGKVYLVDGNIKKGEAMAVLAHELGVHAKQLGFKDSKRFKRILSMLERRSKLDTAEGKAIREAIERIPEGTLPEHVNEEALAYLITNSPEISIVRKFIAALKKFLIEKLGVSESILKNIDMQALALAVVKNEARSNINLEGSFLNLDRDTVMASGAQDGNILFSHEQIQEAAKAIYSRLEQAGDKFKGMKAQGVKNWLTKQGVKKTEMEAVGLDAWLKSKKGNEKVTASDLQDFVKANTVELKDVMLGDRHPDAEDLTADELVELMKLLSGVDYLGFDTYSEALTAVIQNDDWVNRWDVAGEQRLIELANKKKAHFLSGQQRKGNNTKFATYQEPGAVEGSYREMFVTAPGATSPTKGFYEVKKEARDIEDGGGFGYIIVDKDSGQELEEFNTMGEANNAIPRYEALGTDGYTTEWQDGHSDYSDIQNPVVRLRFNERTDSEGRKVLFIEEMQGPGPAQQEKMPDYLRDNIYQLGTKRVLAYAKENGFDGVAWTSGDMQADRYDLSKKVEEVNAVNLPSGQVAIEFKTNDGQYKHAGDFNFDALDNVVGKELARKIKKDLEGSAKTNKAYSGLDLKVGGEGLKQLYDQNLGNMFKAYGKGEIGEIKVGVGEDIKADITEGGGKNFAIDGNTFSMRWQAEKYAKENGLPISDVENIIPEKTAKVPFVPITGKTPSSFPMFSRSTFEQQSDVLASRIHNIEQLRELVDAINDEKADTKTLQALLRKAITEHIGTKGLQNRSFTAVLSPNKFKTPKGRKAQFTRALDTLDYLMDQNQKYEVITKIRSKVADIIRVDQRKGHDVSRNLLPEDVKLFQDIRKILNISIKHFEEKIEPLINADDSEYGMTDVQAEEIELLSTYGNLKSGSLDDAMNALKHLDEEITRARKQKKRERAAWKNEIDSHRFELKEEVTGGKGLRTNTQQMAVEARKGPLARLRERLESYDDRIQSWEWLMDKITKGKQLSSKSTVYMRDLVHKAQRELDGNMVGIENMLREKTQEIWGKKPRELKKTLEKNAVPVQSGVKRYHRGQEAEELTLSQNQAYKLWQWLQDPTLTDNLAEMGYDERTLEELEEFMTPEVTEWAQWQIDVFYPEYYKTVNEKYRELFSIDMPYNPRYSPLKRDFSGSMGEDPVFDNGTPIASVVKGSLMNRMKEATAEVVITDGDEILRRHITDMEHFKAWGMPVRKLRSIFNDREVKKAIRQYSTAKGDTTNQVIARFINDFARLGEDAKHTNELIELLRKNFTRYAIGLNPVVFMKQLTSAPAFAANMPAGQWAKYSAIFWRHPIRNAKKLIELSPMLKARYRRGFERDVVLMQRRGSAAFLSGAKTFDDIVGAPTRVGDGLAIIAGGWPLYRYNYNKYKKEGMDTAEAEKKALHDFELSTERLQQAANIKDLSDYQRGGSFQKLFTMFITSPASYFRLGSNSLRALVSRKDMSKAEKMALSKNTFIAFVLLPMMFKFVADGFEPPDDAEEVIEDLVRAPLRGLPFIREIENGIDIAQGKGWNSDITPVGGFLSEFGSAFHRMQKVSELGDITPDDIWRISDSLADGIGQLAGLPVLSAKRTLKALTRDSETPIRSALGWSDTALGKHNLSREYNSEASRIRMIKRHYDDLSEEDPRRARRYKREKSVDLQMYDTLKDYERRVRKLRRRLKESDKAKNEARSRRIKRKLDRLYNEFIEKYNKAA